MSTTSKEITNETRIKEILQIIIQNDNGLRKEEVINYYINEFDFDMKEKKFQMKLKRDLEDIIKHKIVWFKNDKFYINKNFNFEGDAYTLAGLYTIFYFGFKKEIIAKNDVVQFFNPDIFEYEDPEKSINALDL